MEPHPFILPQVCKHIKHMLCMAYLVYECIHVCMHMYIYTMPLVLKAAGMIKTARWLLSNDTTGKLITATDESQDTPAHDAADNG